MGGENQYEHLSADERRLLEAWLLTFDNAWDEKRLAKWFFRISSPARGVGAALG
jgi:hypothetical protein